MQNTISAIPSMSPILEADEQGVWVTAMKTAMELDLFEIIAQGHHSLDDIAKATNCSLRGMSVLLDALCVKNVLDKSDGRYFLTPTSETYLIRSGRGYCVPIYLAWHQARDKFSDFVRTGRSALDLTSPLAEEIWVSYAAPDRVRLPELIPLVQNRWTESGIPSRMRPGAHILDLGCGSGFKSFALLQMDPAARVTGIDSPKVLAITKDVAEQLDVASRVTLQNGDVDYEFPEGTFDMVLIGNLLHYYDPATATSILQKTYRAVKPDGIIVIYSKAVDEERRTDPALLSMVDVCNCAPQAQSYTFSEYKAILEAAGYRDVTQPTIVMISAVK
jgi:ubiquinone/menaquinone biosynthesis C-methylase UbiE